MFRKKVLDLGQVKSYTRPTQTQKMEKASEKAIRRSYHRPAGEKMRWNVLVLAAVLLLLVFPPALHNVSNKLLFVAAFLFPALQIGCALYEFDEIRRSWLVVRESIILKLLSFPFAVAVFVLTRLADPSPEVWLLLSCFYIISGFSFEFGLGLATKLQLITIYSQFAISFPIVAARVSEREMSPVFWAMTLAPVPLSLLLIFISFKYGDPPAAEAEIVRGNPPAVEAEIVRE